MKSGTKCWHIDLWKYIAAGQMNKCQAFQQTWSEYFIAYLSKEGLQCSVY